MNEVPLKRCSRGENCVHPMGCLQPATSEYFYRQKQGRDGLRAECKSCGLAARRHPKGRKIIVRDGFKLCAHCEVWKAFDDFAKNGKTKDRHQSWCKDCYRDYFSLPEVKQRRHEYDTSDRHRELEREKHRKDPEKHRARMRRYNRRHPEKVRARDRRRAKEHPEYACFYSANRRTKVRGLPSTFKVIDWQHALDYFNLTCPVCGRQFFDLFTERQPQADHWIPLSSPNCPGTTPLNIVPLCGGIDGCNQSKHDKLPEVWLVECYGRRKANEILQRIEAYFEWVRSQS